MAVNPGNSGGRGQASSAASRAGGLARLFIRLVVLIARALARTDARCEKKDTGRTPENRAGEAQAAASRSTEIPTQPTVPSVEIATPDLGTAGPAQAQDDGAAPPNLSPVHAGVGEPRPDEEQSQPADQPIKPEPPIVSKRKKDVEQTPARGRPERRPPSDAKASPIGKIAPEKRGGRPRGAVSTGEAPPSSPSVGSPNVEVVCWEWGHGWEIGVRLDHEFLEMPGLEVLQDGIPLDQSFDREECWRVRDLTQTVEVKAKGSEGERLGLLSAEGYLLLKLGGEALEWGRQTRHISKGLHLVVVPTGWRPVEDYDLGLQLASESVDVPGFEAYVVASQTDSTGLSFRVEGGGVVQVESRPRQFELVGNVLPAVADEEGPLFGAELPALHIAHGAPDWSHVGTIVVGEEGGGKRRKTVFFRVDPNSRRQSLPAVVATWGANWLFVRLYDHNDNLLESLDFRFVPGLRDVLLPSSDPLPGECGHITAIVRLVHDEGCSVQLAPEVPEGVALVVGTEESLLTLPPTPSCDQVVCRLGSRTSGHVRAVIRVDRVWWALGELEVCPPGWTDRVLVVSRNDLAATSTRALWVRLPAPSWTERLRLRLGDGRKQYPVARSDRAVAIPLSDFSDAEERARAGETPFHLGVRPAEAQRIYETVPCRLRVSLRCLKCDRFVDMSPSALWRHVEREHLALFFRPLAYDELRGKMPALPEKIYRCGYCPKYVPSDDYPNPTSSITWHVRHECDKAGRDQYGLVSVRFFVVSDLAEIRKYVEDLRNLPHIERCKLCGRDLDTPTGRDEINHLAREHAAAVYELA